MAVCQTGRHRGLAVLVSSYRDSVKFSTCRSELARDGGVSDKLPSRCPANNQLQTLWAFHLIGCQALHQNANCIRRTLLFFSPSDQSCTRPC